MLEKPDDEEVKRIAVVRASIGALFAVVVLGVIVPAWMAFPAEGTIHRSVPWLVGVGLLVWVSGYAMERARVYLRESWQVRNRKLNRFARKRYSFWPGHYETPGRRWVLVGLMATTGWLVLMCVGVWFLNPAG